MSMRIRKISVVREARQDKREQEENQDIVNKMQHGFDYKVSLKHANMRARAHFHTLCVCVAFQILVPTVLHSQVKTEEIKEKKQAKIRSLRLKDYGTKEEEESLVEPSAVSCVVLILDIDRILCKNPDEDS